MKINNETLTAFLDGELDEADAAIVARQVEANPALQTRLSALDLNLPSLRHDYQELAKTAPLNALRVATEIKPASLAANSNARGWSKSAISGACAACLALGLFISPFAVSNFPGFRGAAGDIGNTAEKSWRQAVAEYQSLYTAETLSLNPQDPSKQDDVLAQLSARIGVPLERAKLQISKASFQRGQLLDFQGKPLVQLAFLYDGDKPFALCLVANGAKDSEPQRETRKGMPLFHWARGGVSYMVIGKLEAEELDIMAQVLRRQI